MKKLILISSLSLICSFGFSQTSGGTRARSAKTGQYVSKDYAKTHKSTTVVEKTKSNSSSGSKSNKSSSTYYSGRASNRKSK